MEIKEAQRDLEVVEPDPEDWARVANKTALVLKRSKVSR